MKNNFKSGAVSKVETASADKPKKFRKGEFIRLILLSVFAAVFVCSGTYVVDYYYTSYKNQRDNQQIREIFKSDEPTADELLAQKFQKLLAINSETKGWLNVPGTVIDYPVVQTTDSEFYLTHNFEKEYSNYGTFFADPACSFDPRKGLSSNTIIYGHNMKDGSMMGQLGRYRNIDFYKKNPVFSFTPNGIEGSYKYKVVSVFLCDTDLTALQSPKGVFHYNSFIDLSDRALFDQFVKQISARSMIETGVDIQFGDKFVTLSTCAFDFDEARLVVVGRQVRSGESETVDTSLSNSNGNAVYPYAFCQKYGRSGPYDVE